MCQIKRCLMFSRNFFHSFLILVLFFSFTGRGVVVFFCFYFRSEYDFTGFRLEGTVGAGKHEICFD